MDRYYVKNNIKYILEYYSKKPNKVRFSRSGYALVDFYIHIDNSRTIYNSVGKPKFVFCGESLSSERLVNGSHYHTKISVGSFINNFNKRGYSITDDLIKYCKLRKIQDSEQS